MTEKIKKLLAEASSLSFVVDEWSSKTQKHSLLGISAHFLDTDLKPQHVVIGVEPIKGRPTGENLTNLFTNVMNEFEIKKDKVVKVLRDGASTMLKTCRLLDLDSEHCLAHQLQLVSFQYLYMLKVRVYLFQVIRDALKKVDDFDALLSNVKKFIRKIRKSGKLQEIFREHQKLEEIPLTSLKSGIEVRWSSLYTMLECFVANKAAIHSICGEEELGLPIFSQSDWITVKSVVNSLNIFAEATDLIQHREATISISIPIFNVLKHALEKRLLESVGHIELNGELLDALKKRLELLTTNK